jgi:tRNA dimethylallyltransferase
MKRLHLALALLGPTASGKSGIALELASRLPIEIVSVDSALVYRGMDIGTAKPSVAERAAVPHHLIDIIEPTDAYSAARFCVDATRLIHEITTRARVPLLVGGTMLYFKALREGLSALPQADETVRAAIESEARERGWPALHAELAQVDPATARRLNPGDSQRVQRALEVFRLSGQPMSLLLGSRPEAVLPFRLLHVALVPSDRGALHRTIEARFEAMLRAGLVDEVVALKQRYVLTERLPSMRCVGYRQVWQFLEGAFDTAALRERGIFATRQLAKRQLTWLRSMPDLNVVDCLARDAGGQVCAWVERKLSTA